MKKHIAAFNWKLDPTTLEEFSATHGKLKRLAKKYESVSVLFAPPIPFLAYKHNSDGGLIRAAQTISTSNNGAHTGNISPLMLRSLGVGHAIIGHSEERAERGFTDADIASRVSHALENKVIPIVCFGESVRDTKGTYTEILEKQIRAVLDPLSDAQRKKVVLAYEPIWAIGVTAKRSITTDELFSTTILIKNILARAYGDTIAKKIKILYGGSVKDHNAEELAAIKGINGFLVGSASHKHEQLEGIISALA